MTPRVQDFRFADYVRAAGVEHAVMDCFVPGVGQARGLYLDPAWLDVERWFPITNDAATMHDAFGVFHPANTAHLYTPALFADLAARAMEMSAEPSYARAFALGSVANYWHVVMDFIPRLALAFGSGATDLPLLVGPACMPVQREMIGVLYAGQGWPAPQIVALQPGLVAIRRVVFPFRPSVAEALGFWQQFLPPGEAAPARRRLFVRRGAVARRRLINEGQVETHLKQRGFETVDPGTMSFSAQVETFRDARVVVGAHGAGLTNIAFAPNGGALVEFLAGFEQPFFRSLSAAKGWRRMVVRDPGVPADASHHADFSIDVAALERVLDEVLD
jgi:capsular polysaccharide biosynthesis protein